MASKSPRYILTSYVNERKMCDQCENVKVCLTVRILDRYYSDRKTDELKLCLACIEEKFDKFECDKEIEK
jgi:hypothetical protein